MSRNARLRTTSPRARARDCSTSRSALLVFTWSRNVASNPDSNETLVSERSDLSMGYHAEPKSKILVCHEIPARPLVWLALASNEGPLVPGHDQTFTLRATLCTERRAPADDWNGLRGKRRLFTMECDSLAVYSIASAYRMAASRT